MEQPHDVEMLDFADILAQGLDPRVNRLAHALYTGNLPAVRGALPWRMPLEEYRIVGPYIQKRPGGRSTQWRYCKMMPVR